MAQELVRNGATLDELMEAGRWDSPEVAVRYAMNDDPEDSPVYRFYRDVVRAVAPGRRDAESEAGCRT